MATKIKFIVTREFLDVSPDGNINISTSRKLLADIVKAKHRQIDYELLIDLRDTQSSASIFDVYQIEADPCQHGDASADRRVALLVRPGASFDRAGLFETGPNDRGCSVNAFTDYGEATRWALSEEDSQDNNLPSSVVDAGDGIAIRAPL